MKARYLTLIATTLGLAGAALRAGEMPTAGYLYWTVFEEAEVWRSDDEGTEPVKLVDGRQLVSGFDVDLVNGHIYYGHGDALLRSDLDGAARVVLVEGVTEIEFLELDVAAGKMYWSDDGDGMLRRANLDGSQVEDLVTINVHGAFALDTTTGVILYAGTNTSIWTADLDGSNAQQSFSTPGSVVAVAVDPASSSQVFWAAPCSGSSPGCGVFRADYDGMNLERLFFDTTYPDLHVESGMLYGVSVGQGVIYVSGLDGSGKVPHTTGGDVGSIFFLDLAQDRVYSTGSGSPLQRMQSDGSSLESLTSSTGQRPHGIGVDVASERVFVADDQLGLIYSTPLALDASTTRLALEAVVYDPGTVGNLRGLTVGDGGQRLFWAQLASAPSGAVVTSGIDGSAVQVIAIADSPHDVAVDEVGSRVFWNEGIEDSSGASVSIRRAAFDGSGAVTTHSSLSSRVRGLAIDNVNGRLYWADHDGVISRSDLDGGNIEDVVTGLTGPHDVAVDPVGGKIYWTEGTTGGSGMTASIRRSDLDGNNVEDVLTGLSVRIRDLVFVRHRVLPIFEDGFELGTASLWSSSTCAPDC